MLIVVLFKVVHMGCDVMRHGTLNSHDNHVFPMTDFTLSRFSGTGRTPNMKLVH